MLDGLEVIAEIVSTIRCFFFLLVKIMVVGLLNIQIKNISLAVKNHRSIRIIVG